MYTDTDEDSIDDPIILLDHKGERLVAKQDHAEVAEGTSGYKSKVDPKNLKESSRGKDILTNNDRSIPKAVFDLPSSLKLLNNCQSLSIEIVDSDTENKKNYDVDQFNAKNTMQDKKIINATQENYKATLNSIRPNQTVVNDKCASKRPKIDFKRNSGLVGMKIRNFHMNNTKHCNNKSTKIILGNKTVDRTKIPEEKARYDTLDKGNKKVDKKCQLPINNPTNKQNKAKSLEVNKKTKDKSTVPKSPREPKTKKASKNIADNIKPVYEETVIETSGLNGVNKLTNTINSHLEKITNNTLIKPNSTVLVPPGKQLKRKKSKELQKYDHERDILAGTAEKNDESSQNIFHLTKLKSVARDQSMKIKIPDWNNLEIKSKRPNIMGSNKYGTSMLKNALTLTAKNIPPQQNLPQKEHCASTDYNAGALNVQNNENCTAPLRSINDLNSCQSNSSTIKQVDPAFYKWKLLHNLSNNIQQIQALSSNRMMQRPQVLERCTSQQRASLIRPTSAKRYVTPVAERTLKYVETRPDLHSRFAYRPLFYSLPPPPPPPPSPPPQPLPPPSIPPAIPCLETHKRNVITSEKSNTTQNQLGSTVDNKHHERNDKSLKNLMDKRKSLDRVLAVLPFKQGAKMNTSTFAANKTLFSSCGYSPPILPIPSYQNSLELISRVQKKIRSLYVPGTTDIAGDELVKDITPGTYLIKSDQGLPKKQKKASKRKQDFEEDAVINKIARKISLEEYKNRSTKNNIKCTGIIAEDEQKEKKQDSLDKSLQNVVQYHDSDLGYDSDTTVKL